MDEGKPNVNKPAFLFVCKQNLTSLNDCVSEVEATSMFMCNCEPPVACEPHLA